MPRRRSRGHSAGDRQMQSTRWDGGGFTFLAFSAGTIGGNQVTADELPPETILRVRGEIVCYLDSTITPPKLVDIAIGMALVPEGTSATVQWSPITDPQAPWFFYERFTVGYEEVVTDVIDVPGITSFRKSIDDKAMRIIRPGVEVQTVAENVTLGGAATVNIRGNVRFLFGAT